MPCNRAHRTLTCVDQGYTGEARVEVACGQGIELKVVKHTKEKKGLVPLPRRWVVKRTFGWLARFRRLARRDAQLTKTLGGWY